MWAFSFRRILSWQAISRTHCIRPPSPVNGTIGEPGSICVWQLDIGTSIVQSSSLAVSALLAKKVQGIFDRTLLKCFSLTPTSRTAASFPPHRPNRRAPCRSYGDHVPYVPHTPSVPVAHDPPRHYPLVALCVIHRTEVGAILTIKRPDGSAPVRTAKNRAGVVRAPSSCQPPPTVAPTCGHYPTSVPHHSPHRATASVAT